MIFDQFGNTIFFYEGIFFQFRFLAGRLLFEWKCDLRFLWLACVNKFPGLMALSGTSRCPCAYSKVLFLFLPLPRKMRVCGRIDTCFQYGYLWVPIPKSL